MGPPLFERIKNVVDAKKQKMKWQRITAAMAILVFALTAYLLVYPALALVDREDASVAEAVVSETAAEAPHAESAEAAQDTGEPAAAEEASASEAASEEGNAAEASETENTETDISGTDDSKPDEKEAADKADAEKDAEKTEEEQSAEEKADAPISRLSIPVTVTWEDEPTGNVEVKLLADGEEKETVLITAKDEWKHTFEDLPQRRAEDVSDNEAAEETDEESDREENASKDIEYTIEAEIVAYDEEKLTEQPEDGVLARAGKRAGRRARAVAEEKPPLDYETTVSGSMDKGFEVKNMLRVANGVTPVNDGNIYEETEFYRENPLGIIGGFHLVGFESVETRAHTNGNILTDKLKYQSNFGTNNLPKEVSYFRQLETQAGSLVMGNDRDRSVTVIGRSINVGTTDNGNAWTLNGKKVDRPSKRNNPNGLWQDDAADFIDLAQVKADTEEINRELSYYTDANTIAHFEDGNNQYLEILDPSGVNVFNLNPNWLSGNSPLRIRGFEHGKRATAIINVDLRGHNDFQLNKGSLLYYTDGSQAATWEVTEWQDGNVIWNFYDSSKSDRQYRGTLSNNEATTALMLAPNATYDIRSNLNGSVIAKKIIVSAESHRTDFTGETIEHSLSFVKVNENGNPLQDATFELHKSSPNGPVHGQPITTGADGKLFCRNLERNTDYYLVETAAPPGYQTINGWIVKIHVDNRFKVTVERNSSLPSDLYDPDTKEIKNNENHEPDIDVFFTKTGPNGVLLSSATFELREGSENGTVHGTVTTEGNGEISFTGLQKTKTYYLVETAAPSGYQKIDPWIVKIEVNAQGEKTITGNPDLEDGVFNQSTLTIENKKSTTEITVQKKWQNAQGQEVDKESGEVTVQLYKKIHRNGQITDVFVKDIVLNPGNGWQHTEPNLPLFGTYTYWQGWQQLTGTETYTYYVNEEQVPDGYTVSYSAENSTGVVSGTLTVTNKAGFDTTLPSTGGSGTTPYRLAGFLFILAGIALCIKKYSISKGGE